MHVAKSKPHDLLTCPHYQRSLELEERIMQLERVLGSREVVFDESKIKMDPGESRMVGLFTKRQSWTADEMWIVLYCDRLDAPSPSILKTYMCRVRKKLAVHGIHPKTFGRGWLVRCGWYITLEDQRRLLDLLVDVT